MRERIQVLLKQHGFEVLNGERSSLVTRRDGVTYRVWPHFAWNMHMEAWYMQAREKTYRTEQWVLLCGIPGTKEWFAIYSDRRPTEIWRELQIINKGGE